MFGLSERDGRRFDQRFRRPGQYESFRALAMSKARRIVARGRNTTYRAVAVLAP